MVVCARKAVGMWDVASLPEVLAGERVLEEEES